MKSGINLLPWRENQKKKRKQMEVFFLMISVFLFILILFLARYFYLNAHKKNPLQLRSQISIVKEPEHINARWVGYSCA